MIDREGRGTLLSFSSGPHALDTVSIRRASGLPAASFRLHLAVDALAVRLTVPPVGSVEDLHLQVDAPCRAHQKKNRRLSKAPVQYKAISESEEIISSARD